jgi:DNA-binding LacI/PurR family transcriptional regulator
LTTFRQPLEESGQQAAQLLIETIHNTERSIKQALIHARLVERASCAPPRH